MNFEELEKEMKETCDHINYDDCDYTGNPCDLQCRDGLILRKFKKCLEYEKKQAVKDTVKEIFAELFESFSGLPAIQNALLATERKYLKEVDDE